jgi:hypothetical protein
MIHEIDAIQCANAGASGGAGRTQTYKDISRWQKRGESLQLTTVCPCVVTSQRLESSGRKCRCRAVALFLVLMGTGFVHTLQGRDLRRQGTLSALFDSAWGAMRLAGRRLRETDARQVGPLARLPLHPLDNILAALQPAAWAELLLVL